MPWIGEAASNGLKLSVRLSSGEDSMTRAGWFELLLLPLPLLELLALGLLELPEEQAARPAAKSVTTLAASTLLPGILLVVNFDLSSRVLRISRRSFSVSGYPGYLVRRGRPRPAARLRPVASTPPPGWTSAAGGRDCLACTCPRQAGTGC